MASHRLLQIAALVVLSQFHSSASAQQSPIEEMDSLVSAGNYQAAYDLGTQNLAEWEGDSQFDFLYGLAALESGNANEAVFALERVAATTTDNLARNHLGRNSYCDRSSDWIICIL